MIIKALSDYVDPNGFKVFTKGHSYNVYMDKGDFLAVYCDLAPMYNLQKDELNNFRIIE
jgi:hypothetical protein